MRILPLVFALGFALSIVGQSIGEFRFSGDEDCSCCPAEASENAPCDGSSECPSCPSCVCCCGPPLAILSPVQIEHRIEPLRREENPGLLAARHPEPRDILHVPKLLRA